MPDRSATSRERVEIYEVGPRDGLQNEASAITVADKVRLLDALGEVGFAHVEATSFVSARWVPQMADAEAVLAAVQRNPRTVYAALVPNMQGYERARGSGVGEIAIFVSASEGFSRHNLNCSIAESLARLAPVAAAAREDGLPLRGYVSCVIACPYDGPTPADQVRRVVESLIAIGCREVSLGDTIGVGTPETVDAMLRVVLAGVPAPRLAGHFHDTYGRALDCVEAALALGLRVFDAAAGGAGGCPYAPGASGNVATGRLAALLERRGFESGLDRSALDRAERLMLQILGRGA